MTASHTRAYAAGHRRAHLVPEGSRNALCGAHPRDGRSWLGPQSRYAGRLASLPDCEPCAAQARVAAAIAAWDGPPQRPGILARIPYHGYMAPIGGCARCEQVSLLIVRGLCSSCVKACRADGTTAEYGWTRADRLACYAELRTSGEGIAEAATQAGVTYRTGTRYERALADAGQAPWRRAS